MWHREVIGEQTFLQTVDTVYEIVTKTPEHVLCKEHPKHAQKIAMAIQRAENITDEQVSDRFKQFVEKYNVKLVPYFDIGAQQLIEPDTKIDNLHITMAVALIACDRAEWTDFIPAAIKAHADQLLRKKNEAVVKKQDNAAGQKPANDEESFSDCDAGQCSASSDDCGYSDDDEQAFGSDTDAHATDSDDDTDTDADKDPVYKLNHDTNIFEPTNNAPLLNQLAQTQANQYKEAKDVQNQLFRRVQDQRRAAAEESLTTFDVAKERERVKKMQEQTNEHQSQILDRFAPAAAPNNGASQTRAPPQIKAGQPIDIEAFKNQKIKLPPNIQQYIDRKKALKPEAARELDDKPRPVTLPPQSSESMPSRANLEKKLRKLRRQQLAIMQSLQELDDLLNGEN